MDTFAFSDCVNLHSVTLPASLQKVRSGAFSDSGLNTIYFRGSAPEFDETALYGVSATAYYPAGDDSWTTAI